MVVYYNFNGSINQEKSRPNISVPTLRVAKREEVLDCLPATVVKAVRDSSTAAVVKRYEQFKLQSEWTFAQGQALFQDLVNATLMTAQQKIDAEALWPKV